MLITDMTGGSRLDVEPMPERLCALVLLSGSVRSTGFHTAIERSVLDLPIEAGRSLLAHWQDHAVALARSAGDRPLDLQVMIDRDGPEPLKPASHELVRLKVQRDRGSFRGSGGVLYDLALNAADDDYLLVASAAQVFDESLAELAADLAAADSDVAVAADEQAAPGSCMLMRCGALRGISAQGYVDLKEQALPAIAQNHRVSVVRRRQGAAPTIRTAAGYVAALRRHYDGIKGQANLDEPYREEWRPVFGIAEEGALVHATARLLDSVVLRGASVQSGAVLVRCLVCGGAVVKRGSTLMDQLVIGTS